MKASTEGLTRREWLSKGVEAAIVGRAACIVASPRRCAADVSSPWGPEVLKMISGIFLVLLSVDPGQHEGFQHGGGRHASVSGVILG